MLAHRQCSRHLCNEERTAHSFIVIRDCWKQKAGAQHLNQRVASTSSLGNLAEDSSYFMAKRWAF
ncbi:hypothetical protein M413DRAFT_33139 [Hebeloma cylindrosporum]|uniref:Uncharacterized protein n=1 Tax=Hebeloma cylindrosporum TaxID=76867 RepID=A0A0C3BRH7_HEBCY|nr:hypothetical protein M413DRAFT_33139 [Hebeloma cylindrosporum h7]